MKIDDEIVDFTTLHPFKCAVSKLVRRSRGSAVRNTSGVSFDCEVGKRHESNADEHVLEAKRWPKCASWDVQLVCLCTLLSSLSLYFALLYECQYFRFPASPRVVCARVYLGKGESGDAQEIE